MAGIDADHHLFQPFQIHNPVNFPDRSWVGALHTDFQLNQSGPHDSNQLQFLLIQKIRRNFKMKICHPIIMLLNMSPYFQCMALTAVKGPVHKFHLRNPVFQKIIQFPLYQFQIPETDGFIHRRKTIAAGKRTAPAAFIINDSVFKALQPGIKKGNPAHIHDRANRMILNSSILPPIGCRRKRRKTFPKFFLLFLLVSAARHSH